MMRQRAFQENPSPKLLRLQQEEMNLQQSNILGCQGCAGNPERIDTTLKNNRYLQVAVILLNMRTPCQQG
jgi:hypothetical protein